MTSRGGSHARDGETRQTMRKSPPRRLLKTPTPSTTSSETRQTRKRSPPWKLRRIPPTLATRSPCMMTKRARRSGRSLERERATPPPAAAAWTA